MRRAAKIAGLILLALGLPAFVWSVRRTPVGFGFRIPSVFAQAVYQQKCPANTIPITGIGWQASNLTNDQLIQWGCLDNIGDLFIGKIAYVAAATDIGPSLNSIDATFGSGNPGEIYAQPGTISTAVTINNNHVLHLTAGTYNACAMITLNGSGILGSGGAMWTGAAGVSVSTVIKECSAANLPAVVKMIGGNSGGNWLHDVAIDGNKANQTCPSPPCYGIWNFKAVRPEIRGVSIQNAFSAGLMIESGAWPANESCCGSIIDSMILNNSGSALKVQASSDLIVTHNEFENSNIGAELIDSPNKRFVNNDFGGNTLNGIKSTCTVAGGGSGAIITNNQFGNNLADDIFIDAWTGSAQCNPGIANVITANQFVSGASRTANTFDAIKIQNSKFNSITGNNCNPAVGATSFKNCIELASPNTAEGTDIVTGNSLQGWGTSALVSVATTSAWNNSGANNALVNGSASFPSTIQIGSVTFATLPASANGTLVFCSDCNATCAAGASTGRMCSRENGSWVGF